MKLFFHNEKKSTANIFFDQFATTLKCSLMIDNFYLQLNCCLICAGEQVFQ